MIQLLKSAELILVFFISQIGCDPLSLDFTGMTIWNKPTNPSTKTVSYRALCFWMLSFNQQVWQADNDASIWWKDRRKDLWMDQLIDWQTDGQKNGLTKSLYNVHLMNLTWINPDLIRYPLFWRFKHYWTDRWTDGRTDRPTDRRTDGQSLL